VNRRALRSPAGSLAAALCVVATAVVVGSGPVGAIPAGAARAGAAPAGAAPAGERQAIAWHACRTGADDETGTALDAAGARCGEVTVPLDHTRPGGRTITVAVARRPATDRAHRLGTLLVNTGGPGPSLDGVLAVLQGLPGAMAHGSPAVAARYDLVAIDPRFFGRSTPLECGWPTGLAVRSANVASPDRRSFDAAVARAKDLAARCAGRRDLLPFASTRNVARDLDAVRAALGEQRISYLGWSYGGYLGAVYAQLFPRRVDRLVLDSSPDPAEYGPDLSRERGGAADAAALRDWAGWAARHDGTYHLGATTGQVLAAVERIRVAATRRPLQVGGFRVDADMLPGLLLTVVDTDEAYAAFSAKVRVLGDAAKGLVVTPTDDLDGYLGLLSSTDVVPAFSFSAGLALRCADRAASTDPQTYWRDIQAHRADEPFYGPLTRNLTPCTFWPTTPAEPPTTVRTGVPALMVGATGDPAAPYPGQLALHRDLTGSRLVTLAGAFRHGVYLLDGDACVGGAVDRYLLGGPLPAADVTCRRAAPPTRS